MKVPFLNKKVGGEFEEFISELESSVRANVARARAGGDRELFRLLYPLFALLGCLLSSAYVRNSVRDTVLGELRLSGNKAEFVKAVSYFHKKQPYQKELMTGLQRQVFTGFFHELQSDALLLLNSYYTSNFRGAHIALRCMLEDLYRHLYYRDHQQEFWAIAQAGVDEYGLGIRPSTLRAYLRRASYLEAFGRLNTDLKPKAATDKTLFDLNEDLYASCSSAVHGSLDETLNAFRSNLDLSFASKRAAEVVNNASRFSHVAVPFLLAAHADQFLAVNEYERSLILSGLQKDRRAAVRRALNL